MTDRRERERASEPVACRRSALARTVQAWLLRTFFHHLSGLESGLELSFTKPTGDPSSLSQPTIITVHCPRLKAHSDYR